MTGRLQKICQKGLVGRAGDVPERWVYWKAFAISSVAIAPTPSCYEKPLSALDWLLPSPPAIQPTCRQSHRLSERSPH
ncbi:MAG: hypothetical protein ACFB8W_18770 [Elainellaceae cyanobacterium]